MTKTVKEVLQKIPTQEDEKIHRIDLKIFFIFLGVGFAVGLIGFTVLFLLL